MKLARGREWAECFIVILMRVDGKRAFESGNYYCLCVVAVVPVKASLNCE